MRNADIAARHREHLEEKARIKRIPREVELVMAERRVDRLRKQLVALRAFHHPVLLRISRIH